MVRILLSSLLILSFASVVGGQDFGSLWDSITNGGSSVGNSAAGIATSAWNLIRNGGSTVGSGASNLTQSVGNFVRGNGFNTNANVDQQRSAQSNNFNGQGYYGDSPYQYKGYDSNTQRPSYDQNQNGNNQGGSQQRNGNNQGGQGYYGDSPYQYNGYQYATDFTNNRGRRSIYV